MKISKLFHWLYAILMLLPFLVFLPNAFYYGFNESAVAQEKTEQVPVYFESNEITTISDFIPNHVYYYSNDYQPSYTGTNNKLLFYIDVDFFKSQFNQYSDSNITSVQFTLSANSGNVILWVTGINTEIRINSQPFYFVLSQLNDASYTNDYVLSYIHYTDKKFIKEYQPMTTNMSITDSMSYAWDSVWQNDLFSWSYGSFLTEPFIYIGNVFNVPVDNTLYYALSYWLDISIIWLCFDVIMYVPLLVHRWLDKGIVE